MSGRLDSNQRPPEPHSGGSRPESRKGKPFHGLQISHFPYFFTQRSPLGSWSQVGGGSDRTIRKRPENWPAVQSHHRPGTMSRPLFPRNPPTFLQFPARPKPPTSWARTRDDRPLEVACSREHRIDNPVTGSVHRISAALH